MSTNEPMTQEQLDAIRGRLDARTPGEWEASGRGVDALAPSWGEVVSTEVNCMNYCYGGTGRGVERAEDAELIAHAPKDITDLLAEVERLRGELVRQERVAVSEEMRLRRKKAALLIELDATYRKHGETGIEQHHLDVAQADLNAALGGGDDE